MLYGNWEKGSKILILGYYEGSCLTHIGSWEKGTNILILGRSGYIYKSPMKNLTSTRILWRIYEKLIYEKWEVSSLGYMGKEPNLLVRSGWSNKHIIGKKENILKTGKIWYLGRYWLSSILERSNAAAILDIYILGNPGTILGILGHTSRFSTTQQQQQQ